MSLCIKQNVFSIQLKNSFRFGAKIDFKNKKGIKIAHQIFKKNITVSFDSSLFYSNYVDFIFLAFALSRRSCKKAFLGRADEYEQILR